MGSLDRYFGALLFAVFIFVHAHAYAPVGLEPVDSHEGYAL